MKKLIVAGGFPQGHMSVCVNEAWHHSEASDINLLHVLKRLNKCIGLSTYRKNFLILDEN